MFALVDCNSCYASCEQIFRPDLRGKPVVVLSNNDGCIVAKNKEAKALGIAGFDPYFKLKPLLLQHNVQVFSSNYALYGDTSNRVMQTLRHYSPEVEVYSIDEMFLQLDGIKADLKSYGQSMRQRLWREVRMPVGVGIAPTKTLAKLANHAAKKIAKTEGVCVLDEPHKWQWLLQRLPVAEVWGIGARMNKRLQALGINTIAELANSDAKQLRKQFSVGIEKTIAELNGESCLALEEAPPPKQQIYCTRSFGQKVYLQSELEQAACLYAGRAAEKLRAQNSLAKTLHVFIQTSRHGVDYFGDSITVQLPYPCSDSRIIEGRVRHAIQQLYRPGYAYAKAGVGIVELCSSDNLQRDIFSPGQSAASEALMTSLDAINKKFGRHTVHPAAEGVDGRWAMRQQLLSPAYTTRWSDIPQVRC